MFILPPDHGDLHVLGLMSGTSGDGVDGALVRFPARGGFALAWHDHFPFAPAVRARLQGLMASGSVREVLRASTYVGELYARAVACFRDRHPEPVDLLAAHGQTLDHDPDGTTWDGIPVRGTLQVLNAGWLAEASGLPVVHDLRSRDMAAGGQGAPLVPFGDLIFFGGLCRKGLLVLNIGGIANLTLIRPTGPGGSPVVASAFDTGPGNMLMDALMERLSDGAETCDRDGRLAASGRADPALLRELLADPYLHRPPPKSTGRDRFGRARLETVLPSWEARLSPKDLVSTLLEFTIESIALAIEGFVLGEGPLDQAILAGGGALNPELVRRLDARLAGICPLVLSDTFGVPVQAREAMAFAALGHAFVRGLPANVPSATGAKSGVLLGSFVPAGPGPRPESR